jgi:hypothetical protein
MVVVHLPSLFRSSTLLSLILLAVRYPSNPPGIFLALEGLVELVEVSGWWLLGLGAEAIGGAVAAAALGLGVADVGVGLGLGADVVGGIVDVVVDEVAGGVVAALGATGEDADTLSSETLLPYM